MQLLEMASTCIVGLARGGDALAPSGCAPDVVISNCCIWIYECMEAKHWRLLNSSRQLSQVPYPLCPGDCRLFSVKSYCNNQLFRYFGWIFGFALYKTKEVVNNTELIYPSQSKRVFSSTTAPFSFENTILGSYRKIKAQKGHVFLEDCDQSITPRY